MEVSSILGTRGIAITHKWIIQAEAGEREDEYAQVQQQDPGC